MNKREFLPAAPNDIEINRGNTRLKIDRCGGYIHEYSVNDIPILFAGEVDNKLRATHACAPNFGPDASGSLMQHGIARTVEWQQRTLVENATDSFVMLEHAVSEGDYAGLIMQQSYMVDEASGALAVELSCHNTSSTPLRAAPGFHPYFALPDGVNSVHVNGQVYAIDELGDAKFQQAESGSITIVLGERTIAMKTSNLPILALWSGSPSRYVCVEPTFSGASFASTETPPENEQLQPNEIRNYSFSILTHPAT